eukprot:gene10347-11451_t
MPSLSSEIECFLEDVIDHGDWDKVILRMKKDIHFARHLAHWTQRHTYWTALHYAAYWGNLEATKLLIQYGAFILASTDKDKRPVDLAREREFPAVASILYDAQVYGSGNWSSPIDASLSASSCWWTAGSPMVAEEEEVRVAYAGSVAVIPQGARYYVDPCGRPLIGWHGSYDPPCGMDGESMLSQSSKK